MIRLLEKRDADEIGGIRLQYEGQTPPWLIVRQVRPRRQKIESKLSLGTEEAQSRSQIIEGENLQAMVSLYKYRGQIDLILTDPPYNTGLDFRYNDKWDEDPNDPDLGKLVPEDDGSRHSKWLRFMTPRLWMMKEMLRPNGVLAICIDYRELFRLGVLLDQIFGEKNRIAIINWQKTYSPKNNVGKLTHVSASTEYVLVYAKNNELAKTNLLPRAKRTDARYSKPIDGDPQPWTSGDLTGPGAATHLGQVYGIQSPFNGQIYYPAEGRCWAAERARVQAMLEGWGCKYTSKQLNDGKKPALVVAGSLTVARKRAEEIMKRGTWPVGYWLGNGKGAFRVKKYLKDVKKGIVPMTYWADEDYDTPLELGVTSWDHEQSGHSQAGLSELNAIVGRGHNFDTVKPLKLFKKLTQIWCPASGIVMDPFGGSGTTAHAVLALNKDAGADRRFIIIEQGRPDRGDPYARSLTQTRVLRAITGERPQANGKVKVTAPKLPGGFRFTQLSKAVDADAVLALEREEMLDLLLTSHWDQGDRASAYLKRLPATTNSLLFAVNNRGNGYFLVWNGPGKPSILDRSMFRTVTEEAKAANLNPPYHVYARLSTYSGPNTEFYQIPDRILDKLGFNEATQPFRID
ncbi:MAG: DNA methyltransferase [Elusimicrobia bacterium GWA2_61_42]|nr:MAG: DNA methyltransferase [Elusimicrobia bacterium GWA2_61_42]